MNAANAADNPTLSALECIEQLYEGGVGAPLGHDACHVSAYHGAGVKFSEQVGEWWGKSKGSVTTYARKHVATNTPTLNLATLSRTNVIPSFTHSHLSLTFIPPSFSSLLPHFHPSRVLIPPPSLSSLPLTMRSLRRNIRKKRLRWILLDGVFNPFYRDVSHNRGRVCTSSSCVRGEVDGADMSKRQPQKHSLRQQSHNKGSGSTSKSVCSCVSG